MSGPRPSPLPRAAMRASTTGSSACMVLITGRPTTSSIREKPPAGKRLSGTFRSLTDSRVRVAPSGSACAATTIAFSGPRRGRRPDPAATR